MRRVYTIQDLRHHPGLEEISEEEANKLLGGIYIGLPKRIENGGFLRNGVTDISSILFNKFLVVVDGRLVELCLTKINGPLIFGGKNTSSLEIGFDGTPEKYDKVDKLYFLAMGYTRDYLDEQIKNKSELTRINENQQAMISGLNELRRNQEKNQEECA